MIVLNERGRRILRVGFPVPQHPGRGRRWVPRPALIDILQPPSSTRKHPFVLGGGPPPGLRLYLPLDFSTMDLNLLREIDKRRRSAVVEYQSPVFTFQPTRWAGRGLWSVWQIPHRSGIIGNSPWSFKSIDCKRRGGARRLLGLIDEGSADMDGASKGQSAALWVIGRCLRWGRGWRQR